MPDATLLIRCPGCGTPHRVAMAVGQQLRCTTCQTLFFAPILTTETRAIAEGGAAKESVDPGGAGRNTAGAPTELPLVDTAAYVPDLPGAAGFSGASGPQPRRRESWREDDDVPPAREPEPPLLPEASDGGAIWTVLTVTALLCIAVTGTILGVFAMGRWRPGSVAARHDSESVPVLPGSSAAVEPFRWVDAVRGAQRLGHLETQVLRVKYGAVRAKDLNNEVITTDDTNLLAITIAVHNRGPKSQLFDSWYTGAPATNDAVADEFAEALPELFDDAGRRYALLRFDDVTSIEGQRLADRIEPQQQVQDTVVFLVPEDIERTQIQTFRLSLPASAVGSAGTFRFEIPARMVVGLVDAPAGDEPPSDEPASDELPSDEPPNDEPPADQESSE